MTEALYLKDSYLKECEATITKVTDGKYIVLDKTIFYPIGGGQPYDTGTLEKDKETFKVIFVKKFGSDISHEVDKEGLKEGDKVKCALDWNRRYELMCYHTAAHVLSGIFSKEENVLITGNQLDIGKGRIDFNLEEFSREKIEHLIIKANELIEKDLQIKVYTISKEEALKDEALFKLAVRDYIQKLKEVRIVDIEGFDKQADGGTHVKSLKEIGKISLLKTENKGKNNRRVYFKLD